MRGTRACATLLFLLCAAACANAQAQHMRTGPYVHAPFGFIAFCVQKPERCRPSSEWVVRMTRERWREIAVINAEVNRAVTLYVDGSTTRAWRDATTVGDCKDYALSKRSRLLDRGYPASALLIARARVANGEMHAVLVVVTDRGLVVLDNLQSAILDYRSLPYRWEDRMTPENPKLWRRILSWLRSNPEPVLLCFSWRSGSRQPRSIALKQRPRDRARSLGPSG